MTWYNWRNQLIYLNLKEEALTEQYIHFKHINLTFLY